MPKKNPIPKLPIPSESDEQIALFNWIAFMRGAHPELDMLYHIPNGGKRNKTTAARLKREGVRAGIPDLCLPVPVAPYHGLYIELKAGKNKPTDKQGKWLEKIKKVRLSCRLLYRVARGSFCYL